MRNRRPARRPECIKITAFITGTTYARVVRLYPCSRGALIHPRVYALSYTCDAPNAWRFRSFFFFRFAPDPFVFESSISCFKCEM